MDVRTGIAGRMRPGKLGNREAVQFGHRHLRVRRLAHEGGTLRETREYRHPVLEIVGGSGNDSLDARPSVSCAKSPTAPITVPPPT